MNGQNIVLRRDREQQAETITPPSGLRSPRWLALVSEPLYGHDWNVSLLLGGMMRIGLVGAGRIGTVHAGLLAEMPDVTEIMISDPLVERAQALAGTHAKVRDTGLDELFESSAAIAITSSTNTHADLLQRAAASGLPAFCEKPIALDLESTRAAVRAVEAAGIAVQMGFQRRYDPAMRKIRDRIAGGDIGTPYLVRSQTHDPEPPPMDYIPVSGGIFKDCLVHDIDIVRYVTGQDVVSVRAAGAVLAFEEIGELGDVDSATVVMEMSGGTLAQLSGLRHDPVGYDVRLEVFGSKDSVAAGWSDRTPIHSAEPGSVAPADPITSWLDRFGAAYRNELEAFLRVARGEEQPAATARDALEDLRVATACDLSHAENRTVTMEEIE